jgi:hypothetical protein
MVATNAIRDENPSSTHSPYPLRSSSQSALLLCSPLRTPRCKGCINLVSGTSDASTSMSGVESDPVAVTDKAKLDQLLGMVTTMNTRLDREGQWLASVEVAIPLRVGQQHEHRDGRRFCCGQWRRRYDGGGGRYAVPASCGEPSLPHPHTAGLGILHRLRSSVHAATDNGAPAGCEEDHPLCCGNSRPRALLPEVPWGGTPCQVQRQRPRRRHRHQQEHIAASTASNQAIWLVRLLSDLLGRDTGAVELRVDSKSALALAKNPVFYERSKHIRVRHHFI